MSDVNAAPAATESAAPTVDTVTIGQNNDSTSARDLANALADWRNKKTDDTPGAPAEAAKEEPDKTAAPAEEATS